MTAAPVSLPDVGVVVTYGDISARKQAEEALRESEARRELALEAARLGTWEWDLRTDRHAWSVFQERLFGYEPGTFPGTSEAFTRRIYPEDLAGLFAAGECARVDGLPFRHEFRVLLPDGGIRWVSTTGRYLFDKEGRPIRVIGVVTDVTERHNAEQRLASEATRRRILIEGSRDGIVVLDRLGGVVETNSRFAEMLGRSVEEVNRMHAWEWDCRWTREEVLRAIVRDTAGAQFETRHRRKDGSEYDVEISTNGAELDGELLVFCLCRDISGRKRLESQLRQAQKLEAVGQLAGGVAHDFNNIIAAMMMQLGLLSMSERLDDETAAAVRDLEAEAQRAAKLTRQLLMFSRRSVMEVRPLDLNELVRDLLKMLGRLIGEHIRLEFRANEGPLPAVEGDAGMVEQVLMNLVVNARDAMPKGGTVTIATRVGAFETGCAGDLVDSLPGHIVCLSVADTGIGMSEETLKHIFEPFFTTKESGKGTGLGLATVHGIVAQHRGWVEVESREGRGSTFRVYFPVADTPFVVAAGDEPFGGAAPRGHETILVVEDETSLRHGIVRTLRALGYRVYEAENGQQAMRLWEKHGREVDLLLTDMVMPEGITGLELGEQLRNHKPSLRMILSTGYSAD
ncbi:MAG: PAS domain S-box protein, partial [Verrucomicrobiales bacterium]|nr:PAS domain S-box protein [Verrucomicrobiales bacterium]